MSNTYRTTPRQDLPSRENINRCYQLEQNQLQVLNRTAYNKVFNKTHK